MKPRRPWDDVDSGAEERFLAYHTELERLKAGFPGTLKVEVSSVLGVKALDRERKEVGAMVAMVVEEDPNDLFITHLNVADTWRHRGLSSLLLGYALCARPHVNSISGMLRLTNWEVYSTLRASGKSHEEALKGTPAYKIRARFGFKEIDPSSLIYREGDEVRLKTGHSIHLAV
ncbi:hypothetical protein A2974_00390 [Candidatus Peregrinibacteria bacterium RIFCSPLOWO2_01_FULL_48_20]|nr:MAG: hypothetical protein A2974_00390 [Candidatus Peregrinibacteria bacterium RIFCSPLOWO2_01_FULL_48_20]